MHAFSAGLQKRSAPHVAGVDQARQPFASAVQVCTCVPEHCVAPATGHVLQSDPPPHAAIDKAAASAAAIVLMSGSWWSPRS
jgi:hypothetical protein